MAANKVQPSPHSHEVQVSTPWSDFRSKLAILRKWLLYIAGIAVSIYSLVIGIDRLKNNAYCQHPLAAYLLVNACLGLIQGVLMFVRFLSTKEIKSPVFRALLSTSLFFFLVMIAWTVLGAAWVFSISDDQCDSTLYASAHSVVITNIVISAIVAALIAYKVYKVHHKLNSADKLAAEEEDQVDDVPV